MPQLKTILHARAGDRLIFGGEAGSFWLSAHVGGFDGPAGVTVFFADADQVRAIRDQMSKALEQHEAVEAAKASIAAKVA